MALKYKVGDRVKIKSLDWYNENKDKYGYVVCIDSLFTPEQSKYCGCEFTISHITIEFRIPSYIMENNGYEWTDEMIEGLVEEEEVEFTKEDKYWCDIMSESDPTTYVLPQGYQFVDENGNVINATKIVLEKKKKEYPKTYEECCKVLGIHSYHQSIVGYKNELFSALQKLIICRDAYWKIAGEGMGLGKPWRPDYDSGVNKYGIICMNGVVQKSNPTTNWERHLNKVLDFPTEEMRDAFKENFDPDIEFCKEFL